MKPAVKLLVLPYGAVEAIVVSSRMIAFNIQTLYVDGSLFSCHGAVVQDEDGLWSSRPSAAGLAYLRVVDDQDRPIPDVKFDRIERTLIETCLSNDLIRDHIEGFREKEAMFHPQPVTDFGGNVYRMPAAS